MNETMLALVTIDDGNNVGCQFRDVEALLIATAVLLRIATKQGLKLKDILELARSVRADKETTTVPEPIIIA